MIRLLGSVAVVAVLLGALLGVASLVVRSPAFAALVVLAGLAGLVGLRAVERRRRSATKLDG